MKKYLLSLVLLTFLAGFTFAQSPDLINYQGVARDASGTPLTNQAIGLQFSIRSGSPTGTVEYQETHTVTTSNLGLFNLQIGSGSVVSGTFSGIDWANNSHYVEVEIDPAGGTSYTALGTQQLVSVPYAKHAATATSAVNDSVNDADADPANEFNTGAALTGSSLSITDGGGTQTVDLSSLIADADADSTNELQTLSIANDTISISNGNFVVLPGGGGSDLDWDVQGNEMSNIPGEINIGQQVNGNQLFSVGDTGIFRMQIGHAGNFNEEESGRLAFTEDVNFNGTCGFEFHHDGSANTLAVEAGCTPLNDTCIVFTRTGQVRIPERVKVGENSDPSADVHIKQAGTGTSPGSSGLRLENSNSTSYNQLWTDGSNLNFSLNTSRIAFISSTGTFNTVSDRRMKTNIMSLSPVLTSVMALNPVQYNYIYPGAGDKKVMGFIAQDVEEIFPGMAGTSPGSDLLALPYAEFSVVAIKAIQEQQQLIEDQQAEIEELKSKVAEIEELKAMVQQLQEQR